MVHIGTYETYRDSADHPDFRMICYTANHQGDLIPSREIAEKAWFSYAQRNQTSQPDQLVFDTLHKTGQLL